MAKEGRVADAGPRFDGDACLAQGVDALPDRRTGQAELTGQTVTGLLVDADRVTGVRLADGSEISAGTVVVAAAKRWYQHDDSSVLPRNIASPKAFRNAMALDVAMGGSTNTVLHTLAAAQEGEVADFDLTVIDEISRNVPCLSKVSPNSDYHMEDVHRAGGIPAILGELRRAGLLDDTASTVHTPTMAQALDDWDIRGGKAIDEAVELFHAAPGGVRTTTPFSTSNRWSSLDTDAAGGCIRDLEHAYTVEGGLCVLRGNIEIIRNGIDPVAPSLIPDAPSPNSDNASEEQTIHLVALSRRLKIDCDMQPKRALYLAGDDMGGRGLKTEAEARHAAAGRGDAVLRVQGVEPLRSELPAHPVAPSGPPARGISQWCGRRGARRVLTA